MDLDLHSLCSIASETMEDLHKTAEKHSMSSISADHQFSDAEESDGEDGDDNDDDDEDDDDFDDQGDLTPKTRSRSTSPQPPRFSSPCECWRRAPWGSF